MSVEVAYGTYRKLALKWPQMVGDEVIKWKLFPCPLWGESTVSLLKEIDADLWCFLLSAPEQRLSKQSRCRWFETPSRLLLRLCNGLQLKAISNMSTNERPLNHISTMFMRKQLKFGIKNNTPVIMLFHQILLQNLNEDVKWGHMIRDHSKPKTLRIKYVETPQLVN